MSKITKKMVKEFISDYDTNDYEYIVSSCQESMKEYDRDFTELEDSEVDSIKKLKDFMSSNGVIEFHTIEEDDLENWNNIDEVFEYLNYGLEINYKAIEYIEENLLED